MEIYGINSVVFSESNEAPHCIVMPWMEHGNINQFLYRLHEQEQTLNIDRWLLQIAEGLKYLHDRNVVHGDLRGANVLIDSDHNVRLTDFGLSIFMRTRTSSSAASSTSGGSCKFQAPELLDINMKIDNIASDSATAVDFATTADSDTSSDFETTAEFPTAVDIYSFACTCIELYSGKEPQFQFELKLKHYHPQHKNAIAKLVLAGERPVRPASGYLIMGDALWAALQGYWAPDPNVRPTAQQLVEDFTSFVDPGQADSRS
ncbi:hypothetical protein EIP86_009264 [Pleurotus ostreatoroseus]|nr:hypothetical protein EIP86_009264 [Pleurotus ostreatoroseus]